MKVPQENFNKEPPDRLFQGLTAKGAKDAKVTKDGTTKNCCSYAVIKLMPSCLKCGTELPVNEEGLAPVLCDRCAGVATSRARQRMNAVGTMRDYPAMAALVAINISVFIAMVINGGSAMQFSGDVLIRWGANWGPATMGGQYWRLVTAGFVHGGIVHLAFNMWCLWSLCQLAERLFGSLITIGIYLLTGVAGALLSIAWNHGRLEVGASGAIFGIAGAILSGIKFGNVSVSPMQRRQIFSSLIFFVIFNLTIGLGPGIDNMCHLGGLVSGMIFGVPLATAQASGKKSFEWATLVLAGFILAAVGHQVIVNNQDESRKVLIGQALHDGDYATAAELLEKMTSENPSDARTQAALGYVYEMNHENAKAIAAYKRALELNPSDSESRQALEELQKEGTQK